MKYYKFINFWTLIVVKYNEQFYTDTMTYCYIVLALNAPVKKMSSKCINNKWVILLRTHFRINTEALGKNIQQPYE